MSANADSCPRPGRTSPPRARRCSTSATTASCSPPRRRKIVTVEADGAWTHGGGFAGYAEARRGAPRQARPATASLYDDERKRLEELVAEMRRRAKISDTFAPKLKAAESRLRQFDERNERPADGARADASTCASAGRAPASGRVIVERLELDGLTDPFDLEVWFGERVAVLGGNGAGKSHFLRLLAGDDDGRAPRRVAARRRRRARAVPPDPRAPGVDGPHAARHPPRPRRRARPGDGRCCAATSCRAAPSSRSRRCRAASRRASRSSCSSGPGATLLLLDEPTDNLDLVSAEALEAGLAQFTGTVVAVTHDRWFLRGFDRFVVFGDDCSVTDHLAVPAAWR